MPYIVKEKRSALLDKLESLTFEAPGELNYAISILMHQYVFQRGMSYTNASEALAQAECAKLEFYRTVLAPYEDRKASENGCVSGLDSVFLQRQAFHPQSSKLKG